jgi:hypothetical protein
VRGVYENGPRRFLASSVPVVLLVVLLATSCTSSVGTGGRVNRERVGAAGVTSLATGVEPPPPAVPRPFGKLSCVARDGMRFCKGGLVNGKDLAVPSFDGVPLSATRPETPIQSAVEMTIGNLVGTGCGDHVGVAVLGGDGRRMHPWVVTCRHRGHRVSAATSRWHSTARTRAKFGRTVSSSGFRSPAPLSEQRSSPTQVEHSTKSARPLPGGVRTHGRVLPAAFL